MSRNSTVITGRGVRFSKHRMSVYINQGQGYKSPYAGLVSRSQTHYALANLLDGALAVKGLGTYASISCAKGMQLNE